MKSILVAGLLLLALASCSPKGYHFKAEGHEGVRFKKMEPKNAGKYVLIGFAVSIGIIGPFVYENVPAARHIRR